MKLLGVLWNSIDSKKDEAIDFIKQYGKVDYIDVDLGDKYSDFLRELYPFNKSEEWKSDYKINGLVDKYDTNTIRVLILDIVEDEKVFLKNKNKMMYKNVLDLKVALRKKYDYLVKPNSMAGVKSYDNVFHLSDDQCEYEKDLPVALKYLFQAYNREDGFITIDSFVDDNQCRTEQWGTRPKLWINRNILFKENPENTFECYSEVFNMYLMRECGMQATYYDLASYKGKKGIITFNVLSDNEFMIDGSHVMSEDESYTKKELIEHNNLEMLENIIKDWCNRKGYVYNNDIINQLDSLFIYDLLTLQPDRNPSNYAIAINKDTLGTRLVCFDNANMLFCDMPQIISAYIDGSLDLLSEREKLKTFLLFNKEDTCFDKKEDIFKEYYENADESKRLHVKELLKIMDSNNLMKIFGIIENERRFSLPVAFKQMILVAYKDYHMKLLSIIKEIDESKQKQYILKEQKQVII